MYFTVNVSLSFLMMSKSMSASAGPTTPGAHLIPMLTSPGRETNRPFRSALLLNVSHGLNLNYVQNTRCQTTDDPNARVFKVKLQLLELYDSLKVSLHTWVDLRCRDVLENNDPL